MTRRPTAFAPLTRPRSQAGVTGLLAAVALLALASPDLARAACDPDPPADDDAVTCTGTDEDGFDGTGATNLTITTVGIVEMDDSSALDAAIAISDGNDVTLGTGSTVTVTEANGAAVRGGDDNNVSVQGTIIVDGANGVGVDLGVVNPDDDGGTPMDVTDDVDPGDTGTTTTHPIVGLEGLILLNGSNSAGVRVDDNHRVLSSDGAQVRIDAAATGAVAIEGTTNVFAQWNGNITIDAPDAWGIRLGDNTGRRNPNGGVLLDDSQVDVNGARSIAMQVGNDAGTVVDGTVNLAGDETRALLTGDRTDPDILANHTIRATVNASGDDITAFEYGSGWISYGAAPDPMDPDIPNGSGINIEGTLNLTGDRGVAVRTGDQNSFITVFGTVDVGGVDSIGFSLGGNDLFSPYDEDDDATLPLVSSLNVSGAGSIVGGPDAGPLVLFRDAAVDRENRLRIDGEILADLTNLGTTDRAIAVRGTSGNEVVFHFGTVRGDVELGDGDDRYEINGNADYQGGTIDGGAGANDTFILGEVQTAGPGAFDASTVDGFEEVVVRGATPFAAPRGWTITNGGSLDPSVLVRIADGGRLVVADDGAGTTVPTLINSDLSIDPGGSILIATDGTTANALEIQGTATLAGELIVQPTENLTGVGTVRLVQATTVVSEFDTITLPSNFGVFSFDTMADANGLDLIVSQGTFAAAGAGANRSAIGGHLDALQADGSTPMLLADTIDELFTITSDLNPIYDSLSPEAYDAQTTMIAESSRRIASVLFDRPRDCVEGELDRWSAATRALDCHAGRLSAWATGIGTIRERDANADHPEYEATLGGLVLGVDLPPIANVDVTLALAAQRGQIDVTNSGESDLVLANLIAQASWQHAGFRLQGATSYGYGAHNDKRGIRIDDLAAPLSLDAEEDHSSHHIGASAQASYLFDVGPIGVEPIVALDYVFVAQDEIDEKGAGVFGLEIDEREDSILFGSAGLRLSTVYNHDAYLIEQLNWIDGIWRPTLDLRWRQTLVGAERELEARLAGAPDTVSAFEIDGEEDEGGFEVGIGVTFIPKLANRLEFDLRYDVFAGPDTLQHDLVAKLRIGF